jgi:hypothetical protein
MTGRIIVIANVVKQSSKPAWIASPCGFAMTEGVTTVVTIKREAIRRTCMDCFTRRVRNDGAAGRLYVSSYSLSALLKCSVFFPMTIQGLYFATIELHPVSDSR